MSERTRREPWPWILCGMLAFMITGSLTFLQIAIANPDPVVVDDAYAANERIAQQLEASAAERQGERPFEDRRGAERAPRAVEPAS